jgi:hypothetical protein
MSIVHTVIELLSSLFAQWMGQPPKLTAEERRDLAEAKKVAHLVQPDDGADGQDHWYDWEGLDHVEFWTRILDIEAAGSESPDAMDAKAREHGLPGLRGYSRVKATFTRHFESDPAFMQAMMTARTQEMQGWMDGAADAQPGLLEPIEGVSVETWATIAATLTTLGDDRDAYHRVLAEHDLDAETYERVQQEWCTRMRSAADPMGAAKIAQIYGAAFTQTRAPVAAEPCSFERYAEIMGAQSAWSKDGQDLHGRMKQTFGITPVEFTDFGTYWTEKIRADIRLAGALNELLERYEAQYRTAAPADADLVL